jgi:hypothetical protein
MAEDVPDILVVHRVPSHRFYTLFVQLCAYSSFYWYRVSRSFVVYPPHPWTSSCYVSFLLTLPLPFLMTHSKFNLDLFAPNFHLGAQRVMDKEYLVSSGAPRISYF